MNGAIDRKELSVFQLAHCSLKRVSQYRGRSDEVCQAARRKIRRYGLVPWRHMCAAIRFLKQGSSDAMALRRGGSRFLLCSPRKTSRGPQGGDIRAVV